MKIVVPLLVCINAATSSSPGGTRIAECTDEVSWLRIQGGEESRHQADDGEELDQVQVPVVPVVPVAEASGAGQASDKTEKDKAQQSALRKQEQAGLRAVMKKLFEHKKKLEEFNARLERDAMRRSKTAYNEAYPSQPIQRMLVMLQEVTKKGMAALLGYEPKPIWQDAASKDSCFCCFVCPSHKNLDPSGPIKWLMQKIPQFCGDGDKIIGYHMGGKEPRCEKTKPKDEGGVCDWHETAADRSETGCDSDFRAFAANRAAAQADEAKIEDELQKAQADLQEAKAFDGEMEGKQKVVDKKVAEDEEAEGEHEEEEEEREEEEKEEEEKIEAKVEEKPMEEETKEPPEPEIEKES
eukprot:gnl/TRDRNA2_/TRDRNA2_45302_c0_seq1.p1 gnl/TRDRNA2_/TRDRNA2_45302_c0~~gnl/TRDRNA2_/TRDRNA2_45302_c0_seq1.p1  ORF type:complete len:354 (-),score=93.54 gnl/TRDRNA2_/TRDRNA2_45302_c0_seq1:216-1277(-)